jgi:hypothetical protein
VDAAAVFDEAQFSKFIHEKLLGSARRLSFMWMLSEAIAPEKQKGEWYNPFSSLQLNLELNYPIGVLEAVAAEPLVVWRITPLWSVKK